MHGKNTPATRGDIRDAGSILGRKIPGGGRATHSQGFLPGIMDKGAWRATDHRVQRVDMTEAALRAPTADDPSAQHGPI